MSWERKVRGTKVPGNKKSRERKVPHRDLSFLGTKGLGHEKSDYLEFFSKFGCVTGNRTLRTQDTLAPRHFGTSEWTFRQQCMDTSALAERCWDSAQDTQGHHYYIRVQGHPRSRQCHHSIERIRFLILHLNSYSKSKVAYFNLPHLHLAHVYLLWPNGWMDQDATWNGGICLSPGRIVLDEDLAPQKGHSSPHFSAHVYGQTVTHLSNC